MAGGKGGSQTTQVQIPQWLEDAGKRALAKGEQIAQIGYMPYYGPDVAALTAPQVDAMRNTNRAASAFGLPHTAVYDAIPAPQDFGGGVRGYSSGTLYDQAVAELQNRRPGQYDALMSLFVNPGAGGGGLDGPGRGGGGGTTPGTGGVDWGAGSTPRREWWNMDPLDPEFPRYEVADYGSGPWRNRG